MKMELCNLNGILINLLASLIFYTQKLKRKKTLLDKNSRHYFKLVIEIHYQITGNIPIIKRKKTGNIFNVMFRERFWLCGFQAPKLAVCWQKEVEK